PRNRLGRSLAGARIGVGALAAYGQRAAMAQAAIAAQIHQALDVHRHLAAKVTLHLVVPVDGLTDRQHFRIRQLMHAPVIRDVDLVHDLTRKLRANAVNVLQRDHHALVGWNIDASDAGHVALLGSFSPPQPAACCCRPDRTKTPGPAISSPTGTDRFDVQANWRRLWRNPREMSTPRWWFSWTKPASRAIHSARRYVPLPVPTHGSNEQPAGFFRSRPSRPRWMAARQPGGAVPRNGSSR